MPYYQALAWNSTEIGSLCTEKSEQRHDSLHKKQLGRLSGLLVLRLLLVNVLDDKLPFLRRNPAHTQATLTKDSHVLQHASFAAKALEFRERQQLMKLATKSYMHQEPFGLIRIA